MYNFFFKPRLSSKVKIPFFQIDKRSKLDKCILEEKKKNISLSDSIETSKSLTDKVQELENISECLVFNDYNTSDEMYVFC
jgi:hypothetical protein